ncbi:MAG: PEGA domain-containing protein [Acidobacteriota bacterium]
MSGSIARAQAAALLVLCATGVAQADRVVALAPLSTLGAEDKSAATRQLTQAIEHALGSLQNTKVIGAAQVAAAADKARRPQLKTCEDDAACVTELGKLVGANIVVTGEVGGLGESRVVYLGATDVTTGKVLRSTTLAVGGKSADQAGPMGAAVRLLDPDKYRGTVHLAIDVSGATVYVNGSRVTLSGKGELALPVGTQAIRVTHPEYHDFVRFVDVPFNRTAEVQVPLQQYPIIEKDVKGLPTSRDKIDYIEPPLWRRWYVAGPAALALAITGGIIAAHFATSFPSAPCHQVGGGGC